MAKYYILSLIVCILQGKLADMYTDLQSSRSLASLISHSMLTSLVACDLLAGKANRFIILL